jgi:Transposase DDE domain group 1
VRGDSHYARTEAMAWCERQRVGYIFGLAGNKVLLRQVSPLAQDAALGRLDSEGEKVRRYGDFRYAAKSWKVERRVVAASRPVRKEPTAASSSPTCRACPRCSMRRSIARAGRPKT